MGVGKREESERNWHLAVRVAAVSSVVMAVLGAAVLQFTPLTRPLIVAMTAVIGLVIGLCLPAAAPSRGLRAAWVVRSAERELRLAARRPLRP